MHEPDNLVSEVEDFLRRAAQENPQLFQVRIDVRDAKPPIWRRLNLRSDLNWDQVHQAIQCAFYWVDYHLHKFALGGGPFSSESQHFLCGFDADEIKRMLQDQDHHRAGRRIPPRVFEVLQHISSPEVYLRITSRLRDLHDAPLPELTPEDWSTALAPFAWFLDQADQGNLKLTQAGFLKPAIVQRASEVLPTGRLWIVKKNREDQTLPVLRLRQNLQRMGLLRKYKGELRITKRGPGSQPEHPGSLERARWSERCRLVHRGAPAGDRGEPVECPRAPQSAAARAEPR